MTQPAPADPPLIPTETVSKPLAYPRIALFANAELALIILAISLVGSILFTTVIGGYRLLIVAIPFATHLLAIALTERDPHIFQLFVAGSKTPKLPAPPRHRRAEARRRRATAVLFP